MIPWYSGVVFTPFPTTYLLKTSRQTRKGRRNVVDRRLHHTGLGCLFAQFQPGKGVHRLAGRCIGSCGWLCDPTAHITQRASQYHCKLNFVEAEMRSKGMVSNCIWFNNVLENPFISHQKNNFLICVYLQWHNFMIRKKTWKAIVNEAHIQTKWHSQVQIYNNVSI